MPSVFIIEDHDLMRQALQELVEANGFTVNGTSRSAEDVEDGFGAAAPDLVMIDLSLPGMSGDRLTRRLIDLHPGLRVVIVTGHEEALYRDMVRKAGAHGFVMKDDPARILDAVRAVASGGTFPPDS